MIKETIQKALQKIRIEKKLSAQNWAEKFRFLTSGESAQVGRYSASLTPYAADWYAAFDAPEVEEVVIVAGAQVGKTQFLLNLLGSIIDQYPANILWVWPDLEQAKKFARHRLKLLMQTPKIKRLFKKNHAAQNQEQIVFSGGSINLVGSNSPAQLASLPCRFLICDEVDRLNASTAEGSALELAKARTRTFFNRKIILTSTPTNKTTSQIYNEYMQGSKGRYCFQCACGADCDIVFNQMQYNWDEKKKRLEGEILFACPHCGVCYAEKQIKEKMRNGDFFWKHAAPASKIRSFWLNAFISPFISWFEIIEKYEKSKNDINKKRVITNTLLGELWEGETIDQLKQNELLNGRIDLGEIKGQKIEAPAGIEKIVLAIDTQDSWFACQAVAYGKNCGLCVLERFNLTGIPSEQTTLEALENALKRTYLAGDGQKIPVSLALMDSGGHFTSTVYSLAYKHRNTNPRILALKGQGGESVQRLKPPVSVPISLKDKRQVQLFHIGVDSYKALIFDLIEKEKILFPLDPVKNIDETYFEELLSEVLEIRNGKQFWRQINRRNESLDTLGYALAGLEMLGCDINNTKKIEYKKPEEKEKEKNNNIKNNNEKIEQNNNEINNNEINNEQNNNEINNNRMIRKPIIRRGNFGGTWGGFW